jgi:palmitoyl-protein thioesterase
VVPRESAHFGFYNGTALLALADTELYREDWIGLRALDEGGRLHLEHCPGAHMQFSLAWFEQAVVLPYLAVRGAAGGTAAAGSAAGVGTAVR